MATPQDIAKALANQHKKEFAHELAYTRARQAKLDDDNKRVNTFFKQKEVKPELVVEDTRPQHEPNVTPAKGLVDEKAAAKRRTNRTIASRKRTSKGAKNTTPESDV